MRGQGKFVDSLKGLDDSLGPVRELDDSVDACVFKVHCSAALVDADKGLLTSNSGLEDSSSLLVSNSGLEDSTSLLVSNSGLEDSFGLSWSGLGDSITEA